MRLIIDGRPIIAKTGETLLMLARRLGFITGKLSTDPLVAKIAGDIFTLNYIPVRESESTPDGETKRKAMEASGGVVTLLRYRDAAGVEAYTRTAQFVIFLAIEELWPEAEAKMSCTVGSGLYIKVSGVDNFSHTVLKEKIASIVKDDIVIHRRRIKTSEAIAFYNAKGREDKARLLSYRQTPTFDIYEHGDFADYYYGEMMASTGALSVWDILPAEDGFIFIFPDKNDPDSVSLFSEKPRLLSVCKEGKRWGELMECETVADLNELVEGGKIRELIRVNEALHERRFSQVADMICERGARAVMLAGPSSSGKTTSANRLATQLRVHGKRPILMSLDDYYIDRDKVLPGEDGRIDLEHINTIDTGLFAEHLCALLQGKEVEIPSYSFALGRRVWNGHKIKLERDAVIIIEGLHALNPVLLPQELDPSLVFKLYVSPLLALNLDDHNRIPSSYLRLLRRIVRDYETRNSSVGQTVEMWGSVRRGEERWIYPFQENADVIFNSSTLYELAVLKKHIFPLLTAVEPDEDCYDSVRSIVKILNFVHEADVDDEIPPTSLVREFVGGNAYYKK